MSARVWCILLVVTYALTLICMAGKAITEQYGTKWPKIFGALWVIFGALMLSIMCILWGGLEGVVIPVR